MKSHTISDLREDEAAVRQREGREKAARTLRTRFWHKVEKTETCWIWHGKLSSEGYGSIGRDRAHRRVYEVLVGPIPSGLVIDHLCRNRACVNPAHLEPVTNAENAFRTRRSECHRGHPLVAGNIRIVNGGTARRCLACAREYERNYMARRRRIERGDRPLLKGGGSRPRVVAAARAAGADRARVARELIAAGLSQSDVAERLGVHHNSVDRWFRKYPA